MKSVIQRESAPVQTAEREGVEYVSPAVNIYETEDGYLLEADMPGVTRESLEIYLEGNELKLIGRRPEPTAETVHLRESNGGHFRRVFELDPEIDTDRITARVENGVLRLSLTRREQLKPRRITVGD